jgi:hypothetical protein
MLLATGRLVSVAETRGSATERIASRKETIFSEAMRTGSEA